MLKKRNKESRGAIDNIPITENNTSVIIICVCLCTWGRMPATLVVCVGVCVVAHLYNMCMCPSGVHMSNVCVCLCLCVCVRVLMFMCLCFSSVVLS